MIEYKKVAKGVIHLDDIQERVYWDKYSDGVVKFWSPRLEESDLTKEAIEMAKHIYYSKEGDEDEN